MKITTLLANKNRDIKGNPIPTIAFLGDSVTQGCFELYQPVDGGIDTVFEGSNAYHARLKELLQLFYPRCPVTMVNAGISGGKVGFGLERLERDVLSFHPDLTVVSFGLNDCGKGEDTMPMYAETLREIFTRLQAAGSEVIFLTQNMMNTKLSHRLKGDIYVEIAEKCMKNQNDGVLERFFEAAKKVAAECNVPVCDMYAYWKRLYESGVDTTELLSNAINHPVRDMHRITAHQLWNTILEN